MQLGGDTVLITGGSAGIGLAFAERFLRAGSDVIICGRSADKLRAAQKRYPQLRTRVCDVGQEQDRIALREWVTPEFPDLNVLVNDAGIQRRIALSDAEDWTRTREEIAINLDAPCISRVYSFRTCWR